MAKKKTETPTNTCRDCKNCHSHYNTGYDGRPILGRCNKSEHAFLLRQEACKEFVTGEVKAPCTGKEVTGTVFTKAPAQEITGQKSPRQAQPPAVNSDTGQMALF